MELLSYKRCQKVNIKKTNIYIKDQAKNRHFFPWSQQVIKLGLCLRPGKGTALLTVKKPIFTSKITKGSSSKNFKNMLIIFFEGVGLLS
jgi:hypothetical protein